MALRIGSLFSGIGGLELGLERAGVGSTVWQCEIDTYARAVLAKHWPDAIRFDDVTTFPPNDGRDWSADVVCGGFPCQNLSSAGDRRGIHGPKSGLWFAMLRVVGIVRPRFVVVENSGHAWARWVPIVRAGLAEIGYASVPVQVRADQVGAWHRRSRAFVIAYADSDRAVESWWSARARWTDAIESATSRAQGDAPDADCLWPEQRRWIEPDQRGWDRDGSRWSAEPDVDRVVHGVSSRMDRSQARRRVNAMANAVVPQVAEVVGRMVVEMIRVDPWSNR